MTLAHHYPEFGTLARPNTVTALDVPDPEDETRLAIFDEGFQAGWDDATQALRTEADTALSGISQRLQDMSFTFEEARTKLLGAQVPVLTQMIGKVLPAAAEASLAPRLRQEIDRMLAGELEGSITISVAPQSLEAMENCLQSVMTRPFSVAPDPLLEPGEVLLEVGERAREVNCDHFVQEISGALDAYLNLAAEAQLNE